jgi:hypothetical protein
LSIWVFVRSAVTTRIMPASTKSVTREISGPPGGLPARMTTLRRCGSTRDIGGHDAVTGVMNFGAKHNDIPVLGDLIRWKLKLPSRQQR